MALRNTCFKRPKVVSFGREKEKREGEGEEEEEGGNFKQSSIKVWNFGFLVWKLL